MVLSGTTCSIQRQQLVVSWHLPYCIVPATWITVGISTTFLRESDWQASVSTVFLYCFILRRQHKRKSIFSPCSCPSRSLSLQLSRSSTMAPYAADSPSLRSSRPGSLQNATSSIPSRKLAQLVSKFETMDLVGSRGTSSKQKSSLRRQPLLLPGSKTMSSLFRSSRRAASSVASGLDSLPSSPSKCKISMSGSVQHLPFVTLYPPGESQAEGERQRAKSTVAETRKMFENGPVAKDKRGE